MISLLSSTPYSEVHTTLDQQRRPDSWTWTKCPPAPISCRSLGEEVGRIHGLRTSHYLSELSSRPIQGSGGTGLFWLSVIIQVPPLQISEDGHDGGPHPPPSVYVRGTTQRGIGYRQGRTRPLPSLLRVLPDHSTCLYTELGEQRVPFLTPPACGSGLEPTP